MIEEYCKYKQLISSTCHFSFLISRCSFLVFHESYELTKKKDLRVVKPIYKNELLLV